MAQLCSDPTANQVRCYLQAEPLDRPSQLLLATAVCRGSFATLHVCFPPMQAAGCKPLCVNIEMLNKLYVRLFVLALQYTGYITGLGETFKKTPIMAQASALDQLASQLTRPKTG
jgi:hypothetical protein